MITYQPCIKSADFTLNSLYFGLKLSNLYLIRFYLKIVFRFMLTTAGIRLIRLNENVRTNERE